MLRAPLHLRRTARVGPEPEAPLHPDRTAQAARERMGRKQLDPPQLLQARQRARRRQQALQLLAAQAPMQLAEVLEVLGPVQLARVRPAPQQRALGEEVGMRRITLGRAAPLAARNIRSQPARTSTKRSTD